MRFLNVMENFSYYSFDTRAKYDDGTNLNIEPFLPPRQKILIFNNVNFIKLKWCIQSTRGYDGALYCIYSICQNTFTDLQYENIR